MHRAWGKPDANQPEIVDALFKAGCRVQVLSAVGMGCPDLLVSRLDAGGFAHMWLMELKMHGEKLTPAQKRWHSTWDYPVEIVHTPEEALAVVMR
jgi:hypothetical protein